MNGVCYGFGSLAYPLPLLPLKEWPEPWTKAQLHWKQVHGIEVAEVVSAGQECGEVDALWTRVPGIPVAVVSADCVPLLLFHTIAGQKKINAVAAIHAGWRGTFARIIENFFKKLPVEFSDPRQWSALIGPCIHSCCYEVSEKLIGQFITEFSELARAQIEPSFRKLDLVSINEAVLRGLGVRIEGIAPACTHCGGLHFSYRKGDRKSRQYSVIMF